MVNGPDRFASPAFFEIVRAFFTHNLNLIPPGTYTESQLVAEMQAIGFGTYQAYVSQQEWSLDDGTPDYKERAYLWNTVAYEIKDYDPQAGTGALFVIGNDGLSQTPRATPCQI